MSRPIDLRRALVAIGAGVLLVSLFLDWYEAGGTAWEVFEALDLLLAGIALACAWAALAEDAPPVLLRVLPPLALVVVLVQLVNPPPVLQLATDALRLDDAGDPDVGLWFALASSLLMTAGAVLSMARISVLVDVADRGPGQAAGSDPSGAGSSPEPASPAPPERRTAPLLDREDEPEAATQPLPVPPDDPGDPPRA